jgi:tetratricopeptide (TPR) repeat protein
MAEEIGQHHSPFVGRDDHRNAYQQMLRPGNGPWMLLITGQGGNGKSRLLRQVQAETPDGIQTGLLDFANEYLRTDALSAAEAVGDCLEPLVDAASFRAFRQEALAGRKRLAEMQLSLSQQITVNANADAQGLAQSMNTGGAVNEMRKQVERMTTGALLEMARGARGRPLALLLDTCEWFHEPGSQDVGVWLKDTLPRLRERLGGALRVVAAGREGLERLFPFEGSAQRKLLLLAPSELENYLQQIGMGDAATRQAVYAMTSGHPLCASIVAQVWLERPFGPADLPAFQGEFSDLAVTQWVSERVLDRLQPPYNDLARYGVLLRSFDLPLLRAVFPELLDSGDQVFRRLTAYSFIVRLAGGRFTFHDLLRQVQAGYLRRQMPERWQGYHRRALRFLEPQREEVFGWQVRPADYYYHLLALDEEAATSAWASACGDAIIIHEKDYWSRLLQAAQDYALTENKPLQAVLTLHQGRYFFYEDKIDMALAHFQYALTLFRQAGSSIGEADTMLDIGRVQEFRDDNVSALASYQQSLSLSFQAGYSVGEANAHKQIGDVLQFQGHYPAALDSYQQALALYRQITSARVGEANTLSAIGVVQQFQGHYPAALDSCQHALALYRQIGNHLGEANTLLDIGQLQRFWTNYPVALDNCQQALALYRQIGNRIGEANSYTEVGNIAYLQRNPQQALESYTRAYQIFHSINDNYSQARTLCYRSFAHAVMGNYHLAIQDATIAVEIAERRKLPQIEIFRHRLEELRGESGN